MTRSALLTLVLLLPIAGCGETEDSDPGLQCVCDEATCVPGNCTLRVINECPSQWGQARVFVGNTDPDAEPLGTSTEQSPYSLCEGFAVGDGFTFVVESEDGRSISNTVGDTFMCEENRPFEFRLVCTQ